MVRLEVFVLDRFRAVWVKAHNATFSSLLAMIVAFSMVYGAWVLAFSIASDFNALAWFVISIEFGYAMIAIGQKFMSPYYEDGGLLLMWFVLLSGTIGAVFLLAEAVKTHKLELYTSLGVLGFATVLAYLFVLAKIKNR